MELSNLSAGLIIWTIYATLALIALVHVFINRRISRGLTLAWILAIVFLPFLGAIAYFIVGKTHQAKTN